MTTPEKLRRRQRVEGTMLVIIGFLMIGQSVYFGREDAAQRECFQDNFIALSEALDARSDLSERETAAQRQIWMTFAGAADVLSKDPNGLTAPEEQIRLRDALIQDFLEYDKELDYITSVRKKNPLPPYPAGTCE